MKKRVLIFFLLYPLIGFSANKSARLSFKVPFNYGVVIPDNHTTWNGYILGFTVSGEVQKNNLPLALEYEFSVIYENYRLSEEEFFQGSYIKLADIKNGLNIKYYFSKMFYLGTGIEFITGVSGRFGDNSMEKEIDTEYLGTDTFCVLKAGRLFQIGDEIFIPAEFKLDFDLTVKKSVVLNFGFAGGIMTIFGY